jgi:aryl-alcohol dehydrogenase-like predicted oxidoreductase
MKFQKLGGAGLEVSALGLGCMGMTWAYSAGHTLPASSSGPSPGIPQLPSAC